MMSSSSHSILILGGGIVGLTCAAVLQGRGHAVTLIHRDAAEATASGVAAGMIAPALEAMNEADPATAFQRLKAAQRAWGELAAYWPETVRDALAGSLSQTSDYRGTPETLARLYATGARIEAVADNQVRVHGDGLVESRTILSALHQHVQALGGVIETANIRHVTRHTAVTDDGRTFQADAVIIAAGMASRDLQADVPSLACLTPIKGHLLEVPDAAGQRVLRAASGYWAYYDGYAKFGATMEAGRDDTVIDPALVADLKARADSLSSGHDLAKATARAGVRAATPDGWPLIGRDAVSGVLVATGMRRNGYIFAPLAAQILLDLIEGRPADATYSYNRPAVLNKS